MINNKYNEQKLLMILIKVTEAKMILNRDYITECHETKDDFKETS